MPRRYKSFNFLRRNSKKGNVFSKTAILAFLIGLGIGKGYIETKPEYTEIISENTKIGLCFTPPAGCGTLVVKEIEKAKAEIYVQAYGFTSKMIVQALVDAKLRGVNVNVILDKSNINDKYSQIRLLQARGIKVKLDTVPGIAHNKVMIIDSNKVITGSFNFTRAADKSNAENLLIIEDASVAKVYLENWYRRSAVSRCS